jgi:hypothetical protein
LKGWSEERSIDFERVKEKGALPRTQKRTGSPSLRERTGCVAEAKRGALIAFEGGALIALETGTDKALRDASFIIASGEED